MLPQSLVHFATSTNLTYDSVPTAYWSALEAFVGIFGVCMPALRRRLTHMSPYCFDSTKNESKYEQYNTPNKLSNDQSRSFRAGIRSSTGTRESGIARL
jgi:hypothetical protein